MGKATVSKFEDGEVNVMIHENVRGKDVYIVQPTCTPVNENLMELMLMISTLRRASARRITAGKAYSTYICFCSILSYAFSFSHPLLRLRSSRPENDGSGTDICC